MFSFRPNNTTSQKVVDVIFGIIAPVLCLYFDPWIFRLPTGPCDTGSYFTPYSTFAYTAIGLGVCVLILWMVIGGKLKVLSSFFTGVFFTGFVFSLLLGILMLPLSLIGLLIMGLGILGFIPFLTALVYLRNGIKALQWAQEVNANQLSVRVALIILGAVIVLGLPAWIQIRYPPVIPAYDTALCSSSE